MAELNFDVLLLICGLLTDVPDVLSFSLTCSTLHPVAVERRLSMRAVTIDSANSVRDLHNFIFVDETRRGKHIRAITIPVHDRSPNASEELLDRLLAVFESTPRVRTLSLYMPGGRPQSLFCHRRLFTAVAKMASLQELNVVAPLGPASNLLFNPPSALKTFRYSQTYEGNGGIPSPSLLCIAPCLKATLEEIELSLDLLATAGWSYVSLPAVRSLTVTRVYNALQLDMLLGIFPNLDRAFIINDSVLDRTRDPLVASREENRERASARKMRPWKALDRVVADLDILYTLGLACPVRHLALGMQWEDHHEFRASAGYVYDIVREHAPTHLALVNIRLPHGFSNLDSILSSEEAVAGITHLVLDAAYWNTTMPDDPMQGLRVYETTDSSWDAMLNALLSGLKVLHLTHIRVVVSCQVNSRYPFCAPIYDSARSFKFERLVAALPSIIPSLTHIFITSFGRTYARREEQERWETSRAWRVRRLSHGSGTQAGMHHLEELSAEDAEAVTDMEEMRATERKEWIVRQKLDD